MLGYIVCLPSSQRLQMNEAAIPSVARPRNSFRRGAWNLGIRVHNWTFAWQGAKRDNRNRRPGLGRRYDFPEVGFEGIMLWLAIKLPRTSFVCLAWVYAMSFSLMVGH